MTPAAKPETPLTDCNAHMTPAAALSYGLKMAIEGLMLALPHVKVKDAKEAHGLISGANNLRAILAHHEPLALAQERESALLTERLSLSQQERHTLEVECRELRVQMQNHDRIVDERLVLIGNVLTLETALRALADKCDLVADATNGIFALLHARGQPYGGPNFAAELSEARACLAAIEQGEG